LVLSSEVFFLNYCFFKRYKKGMSFQLEFGYLPPNVQSYARVTFGTGDSLFLGGKKDLARLLSSLFAGSPFPYLS